MENNNSIKEYMSVYSNPYILQQFNKSDLRWTKKKRKHFNLINRLEDSKIFSTPKIRNFANPFYTLLDKHKKKINYDFYKYHFSHDYEREHYSENDNLDFDINFEYLYIYDILPKEDINKYHEGLIAYSENCKHLIGVADEFSINRSFNDMANHNYKQATHNLQYFIISDKMQSYKWIDDIFIIFQQYSESFYLITYRLKLKEQATNELKAILNSLVLYEPLYHKTRNKKLLSADNNHMLSFNRKRALKDLILEIEYNFISELNNYVPCFLHRHNIISPTLGVYIFDDLEKLLKNKELMFLLDFFTHDYDKRKDNNIIVNFKYLGETDANFCIVNRNFIEKEEYALSYLDNYFSPIAEYLVFHTLSPTIEKTIIKSQQDLNKLLACKCSASKLLKEKIKTLKTLNTYKRLISANQKYSESPFINDYIEDFENCYKVCSLSKQFANAIMLQLENIKAKYSDFENQINSLYQFYDDNLKAIESSTNIRLVRFTLILTAITLLATIFTILISLEIIPIRKTNEDAIQVTSIVSYYPKNDL